jgi:hypothetical protein
MVEQRKQPRGWGQRFLGPRVNCESVPCLPASVVAWALHDPRQVPLLLVWKDDRTDELREIARVAVCNGPIPLASAGWVEVKRPSGSQIFIRTIGRRMPRNGGHARLIVCPICQKPRCAVYGWKTNRTRLNSVFIAPWQCRECAGLSYASEGGALLYRPRTAFGRSVAVLDGFVQHPRPEPWYPFVFVNPLQAEGWMGDLSITVQSL